jgi:hypothetical protein
MKIELVEISKEDMQYVATIKQVDYILFLMKNKGYNEYVKHIVNKKNNVPNITLKTANLLIKGLIENKPIKFVGINQKLKSISKTDALTLKVNQLKS